MFPPSFVSIKIGIGTVHIFAVIPVLDQFVEAASGSVESKFWSSIKKQQVVLTNMDG